MTRQELFEQIVKKKSFLCIGLDPDPNKIPEHLKSLEDPVFEFNRQIIDATLDLCVAYKPNIAFYESMGPEGWITLEKTLEYIPKDILTIADAKRGDIGNTSKMYARTFFETFESDAITVAPYMGEDSVTPFLEFDGKWVIVLGATSNKGATDFQFLPMAQENTSLFEKVLAKSKEWGSEENMMYVVGATQSSTFKRVRAIIPDHFLLVPGVGAQGGDLRQVAENCLNGHCGLLVNSSRGIIYAGSGEDFAQESRRAALELQRDMESLLSEKGLI